MSGKRFACEARICRSDKFWSEHLNLYMNMNYFRHSGQPDKQNVIFNMWFNQWMKTRSSAIADKPRDAVL